MNIRLMSALFVAVSFLAAGARADICLADARKAKANGISHLVVSFEGLMSHSAGFVRKTLIKKISAAHPQRFFSKNLSYTSSGKAKECISDWESVFQSDYSLTVIGHSFGGGIATFKLLKLIQNTYVDHVITLDPRSWSTDSNYSKTKSLYQFSKPANVGVFFNFYQRGGMPGYKVNGAVNYELKNTSHTKVPDHPQVTDETLCLVFADCD